MPSYRTRGLVLKVASHGESDKIVTIYSPDIGRASTIAKGANRSKRRFVNKLELFTLLDITFRPSRNGGLLFLAEAELDNPFLTLRTNHGRYLLAMLACELIIRFTREQDPDPEIFSLLLWLLDSVNRGVRPFETTALFHLRLLGTTGYQPELGHCSICSHVVSDSRSYALQPANGSLVCNLCSSQVQHSNFTLSLQTIKFLQTAQQMDIQHLKRLKIPYNAARETLYVLNLYSRHLLQSDIHSWHFVDKAATSGLQLSNSKNH